jgi:hypothetical protein
MLGGVVFSTLRTFGDRARYLDRLLWQLAENQGSAEEPRETKFPARALNS